MSRPPRPSAFLLTGVWLALAALTGCVNTLTLDTARALPRGESRVMWLAGGGYQRGDLLRYPLPKLEGDVPEEESRSLPLTAPVSGEYGVRASLGLGLGGQVDFWGSAPLPAGLGVGTGLKWQLLGGADGPVALALTGRTGFTYGGNSSGGRAGTLGLWTSEGGLIASYHLRPGRALYLAPRLRYDYLYASASREDEEAARSTWTTSVGSAVGVQLGRLFLEAVVVRTPPQEGSPEGGTLVTGGMGVAH